MNIDGYFSKLKSVMKLKILDRDTIGIVRTATARTVAISGLYYCSLAKVTYCFILFGFEYKSHLRYAVEKSKEHEEHVGLTETRGDDT